jgi:hypothetical protein
MAEAKEKHGAVGLFAGVDYNHTLCRIQHMYHGQPYSRADLTLMPESTLSPVRDLGFVISSRVNK